MGKSPRIIKGLSIVAIVGALSTGLFFLTHSTPRSALRSLAMHLPKVISKKLSPHKSASWKIYRVKHGDTLSGIFEKMGLDEKTLLAVNHLGLKHLRYLHPKQKLSFLIKKKKLSKLKYSLDFRRYALVTVNGDKADLETKDKPLTSNLLFKSAVIDRSLHDAAYRIGLPESMLIQLEHIFRGSFNFSRDIHKGDHFSLLYKEYYIDGKKYRHGDIMAAEFTNRHKKYKAVRFTYPKDHSGYYTPLGHAVQSLFLRYPVHFVYISGHFTYHRFDPYLHRWHTHLGVDFAANRGTPIHSIGNGRIVFIGHDGGYGNCIKIRYGRHYEGLYGHMHRFARHLRIHQHVKKGQVIGYVGSTGWSTGPHLHFSFFINGIPHNWLRFHLPRANPIPRSYKHKFKALSKRLLNTLALYQHDEE